MAWQEVETDIGAGVAGRPKYSVHFKHGGARISLPKGIAAELKWDASTRLRLLVGGGESTGKLRLEPTPKGKITGRPAMKGGGMLVRLGRWPALAPRDVDAVVVEIEIDGSALNFTLPAHAQNVAPAPRQAAPIAGRDANGVPVVVKRDVTDKFFNDPKRPAMASGVRGG